MADYENLTTDGGIRAHQRPQNPPQERLFARPPLPPTPDYSHTNTPNGPVVPKSLAEIASRAQRNCNMNETDKADLPVREASKSKFQSESKLRSVGALELSERSGYRASCRVSIRTFRGG